MNKQIVLAVVALVVIAGGAGIYLTSSQKESAEMAMQKEATEKEMMKEKAMMASTSGDQMMKDDKAMMKKDGAMMKGAGTYESYAPSKLALATADHKVVLFFRAGWCPTCKALDADIKAHLDAIPGTLTILDVDYDNSTELKKKYGVTMQHTMVEVNAQGTLIKKWTGSPTLAALLGQVK